MASRITSRSISRQRCHDYICGSQYLKRMATPAAAVAAKGNGAATKLSIAWASKVSFRKRRRHLDGQRIWTLRHVFTPWRLEIFKKRQWDRGCHCSKILTLSCHTPHSCQPASASFNPQNPQREVPLLMNELGPRCLGLKQSWRLKSPEPIVILTGCAAPRRLRVLACEAPQIIDQDRDSENECSRRYIYPIACELGTHELAGGITSASGLRPFQQTDEVSRTGINSDGSSTVAFNRARAALRFGCEGPDQRPQESQLNMHSLPVEHPLLHSYRKNYFGAHFSLQFLKATLELSLFRSSNSHLPLSIWPISLRASRTQHLALAWQGQADSQRIERHRHAQLKLLWVLSHVWVFRGVCSAPRHS